MCFSYMKSSTHLRLESILLLMEFRKHYQRPFWLQSTDRPHFPCTFWVYPKHQTAVSYSNDDLLQTPYCTSHADLICCTGWMHRPVSFLLMLLCGIRLHKATLLSWLAHAHAMPSFNWTCCMLDLKPCDFHWFSKEFFPSHYNHVSQGRCDSNFTCMLCGEGLPWWCSCALRMISVYSGYAACSLLGFLPYFLPFSL
jgi:hypothetical protein